MIAILPIAPYWVAKKPSAPSRMASETNLISGLPSSLDNTHFARYVENSSMTTQVMSTNTSVHDVFQAIKSVMQKNNDALIRTTLRSTFDNARAI